jgi:hypothetical protein
MSQPDSLAYITSQPTRPTVAARQIEACMNLRPLGSTAADT